jgi:putative peptidoglycan lipid II flippase
MQHDGLALATSLSAMIMTLLLFANLRKRIGGIGGRKLVGAFLKCGAASLIMGVAVYWLNGFAAEYLSPSSKMIGFLILALLIGFGALLYFGLIYLFRVEEVKWLINMVKKRLRISE